MESTALVLLSLYISCIFIMISTSVIAWQRQSMAGANQFAILVFWQTMWSLSFLIELLSPSIETKLFWDSFHWLAAAVYPTLLLWFAVEYVDIRFRRSRLVWSVIGITTMLFLILVLLEPRLNLLRGFAVLRISGAFPELVYDLGLVGKCILGYCVGLSLISMGLIATRLSRVPSFGRMQTAVLILAIGIATAGLMESAAGLHLRPYHDTMPLAFTAGSLMALLGLNRLKIFDITPLARDVLVENLSEEVVVVDAANRVVYLNAAALHSLWLARSDTFPGDLQHQAANTGHLRALEGRCIGRTFSHVYSHWPQLVRRANGQDGSEPLTFSAPGNTRRAYQVHITPLYGKFPSAGGRVIVLSDVTELKAAEDELRRHREDLAGQVQQRTAELTLALDDLRRTKEELERRVMERTAELAAQNRELETFAYSVSHDLKAPLRGIAGYSLLLEEACAANPDPEVSEFVGNIRRATNQMQQLIEDLLAYARFQRQAAPIERVDLSVFVPQVLDEFAESLERRAINIDLQVESVRVNAEPLVLAQALRNLMDNAIKFTRDCPTPTIQVGATQHRQGDSGGCLVWVRDNGIGFDMNYHERIFEIFQRLQRSEDYPGTGVGLALVRKAVERIGGQVWAESSPGQGATFYLFLPASQD